MTPNMGLFSKQKKNCILLHEVYYKRFGIIKYLKSLNTKMADSPKLLATRKDFKNRSTVKKKQ